MKKLLSILLALAMCISMLPAVMAADLHFTDVTSSAWYYSDLKTAFEEGLINGKTATEFKPDDNMTYAEALKLAACMHQRNKDGKVTLANGNPWYQPFVEYCINNEIIPQSANYNYNAPATRAEYMRIFAHALPAEKLSAINNVPNDSIPDYSSALYYAKEIYMLYRAGIVGGVDAQHNCKPNTNIKRSEVATILARMMFAEKRIKFNMGTETEKPDTGSTEGGGAGGGGGGGETTPPATTPLVIKTQPTGATAQVGNAAVTSVVAEGGKAPYTYQWQVEIVLAGNSGWADITSDHFEGATTATLTAKLTAAGEKKVRCVVTDANGDKVTSTDAPLTFIVAEVPLSVNVSNKNVTAMVDDTANLTVTANGGTTPYTYKWEIKAGSNWATVSDNAFFSGSNTATLSAALTEACVEEFRCTVTDTKGNSKTSDSIKLTVTAPAPTAPLAIKSQPASVDNAVLDATANFHVEVEGGKLPYTYQWQCKLTSAASFKDLTATSTGTMSSTGFDTDTVTVPVRNVGSDRYQYRCVITDANGDSVTTNAVSYKIGSTVEALAVKTQPTAIEIAVGESGSLSVEATGGTAPYTYQWQFSTGGTTYQNVGDNAYLSGVKTNTITLKENKPTQAYFRCVITDANGDTVTSQGVKVTVVTAPLQIKTNPTGGTGKVGFAANFTADATGGKAPYTYQWQTKIGTKWEDISDNAMLSGTQTKTLTFKPLSTGTVEFRCVITDADGNSVTSTVAMVAVPN